MKTRGLHDLNAMVLHRRQECWNVNGKFLSRGTSFSAVTVTYEHVTGHNLTMHRSASPTPGMYLQIIVYLPIPCLLVCIITLGKSCLGHRGD
jgi:hypothetical protein